jgi:chorismate lyase / 3-hydroxybenzoate synthase
MHATATRAGLRYVGAAELDSALAEDRGRVLGVVAFGAPVRDRADIVSTWVDMPVVGGERVYEIWTSAAPVQVETNGSIRSAHNAQILFGRVEIPDEPDTNYDGLIFDEYCRIFDHLDALGYPKLLRIWHYIPDIHLDEGLLERYKRFSLGRHEAFIAKGRAISTDAPAASAVGKRPGNTIICFLAAPRPGVPVENPRQVSAYSYPAQYGPRGPTFSRGLFATWDRMAQLYVSGTAAIRGHQSQHAGNADAQAAETILNLRSVMVRAQEQGLIDVRRTGDMQFKVYLREPQYRAIAEAGLREAFGPAASIICLQADICRRELLLEIEAVCAIGPRAP